MSDPGLNAVQVFMAGVALYAFIKSRYIKEPPEPPAASPDEDSWVTETNKSTYETSVRIYQVAKTTDRQFIVLMLALNVMYTILRFVGI